MVFSGELTGESSQEPRRRTLALGQIKSLAHRREDGQGFRYKIPSNNKWLLNLLLFKVLLYPLRTSGYLPSLCGKGAAQYPPRFVQLRFRVTACALLHRRNLSMIETFNVMENIDQAIPGRHTSQSAIDSQTIDDAGLCQIACAKIASCALLWNL